MKSKKEYEAILIRIKNLVKKGEANLSKEELNELRKLAIAAKKYEESK